MVRIARLAFVYNSALSLAAVADSGFHYLIVCAFTAYRPPSNPSLVLFSQIKVTFLSHQQSIHPLLGPFLTLHYYFLSSLSCNQCNQSLTSLRGPTAF